MLIHIGHSSDRSQQHNLLLKAPAMSAACTMSEGHVTFA
jgi:hypothetical protein